MSATETRTSIELDAWNLNGNRTFNEVQPKTEPEPRVESPRHSISGSDNVLSQQLAPADSGPAAYKVLIGAFVFEALLWGFPMSFGVFQEFYSTLPEFKDSPNIALIGTISQGICYMGSPVSMYLTKRFPRRHRLQLFIGWPICMMGLVAASFADSIGGLVATQGVLYGVGFILLTYPIISMLDEYWIQRKGMAFGLLSAASGASGAVMPFIVQWLLSTYGYKTAFRVLAVAMSILTAPLLPVFRGRLPISNQTQISPINFSFLSEPLFYILGVSTMIQGFGFFFPSVYLPSYAASLGLDQTMGALLLSLMSISQVAGQFFFGFMSDKSISVLVLLICCAVTAGISTFTLWGFAYNYTLALPLLITFSILYGFFAYGYGSMRIAMARRVSSDPTSVTAIYAIFVFLQGIGNISVSPISNALLGVEDVLGVYGIAKYKNMVVFTASCSVVSAVVITVWWLRPLFHKMNRAL